MDYLKKVRREVEGFVEMVEGDVVGKNLALHFIVGTRPRRMFGGGSQSVIALAQ